MSLNCWTGFGCMLRLFGQLKSLCKDISDSCCSLKVFMGSELFANRGSCSANMLTDCVTFWSDACQSIFYESGDPSNDFIHISQKFTEFRSLNSFFSITLLCHILVFCRILYISTSIFYWSTSWKSLKFCLLHVAKLFTVAVLLSK